MIENSVTAIIKAFERPDKLTQLIHSIRKYYPTLPVVIVDDSKKSMDCEWDAHTQYVYVDYDTGLAQGRNIAVGHVKTPFTWVLDDDFYFTEHTKVEVFLAILEKHGFDLVAGDVIDNGKHKRLFLGHFVLLDNKLFLTYRLGNKIKGQYPRLDFVNNFFLARTDLLKKSPWDPDLKIREHEVFFWRLKKIGAKVTYTNEVSVFHFPNIEDAEKEKTYNKMRLERLAHFHRLACEKMGVDDFLTESSVYQGPGGIFKLYTHFVNWLLPNKNKNLLTQLIWIVWQGSRPILKFIYQTWKNKTV